MCLIFLVVLFSELLLTQSEQKTDPVIARAGDTYITERELVRRFEMLPGLYRHGKSKTGESELMLLYSIVAEKLLARESFIRGYDHDTLYRSIMSDLRKSFARDELYRLEISNRISVTSEEVKHGIDRALAQVHIEYFYVDRVTDAEFLHSQIEKPSDFAAIQIDTSWNVVHDTATVIWGDADPAIEDVAYNLKPREISPVIRAGDGYYILQVIYRQRSAFYSSMQPGILRERVESTIRLRKEKLRLNQFVIDVLQTKIGYAVPKQFKLLVESLQAVLQMQQYRNRTALSYDMIQLVKEKSLSSINDTIAVAGALSWSLNSIIDRLFTQGFRIDSNTTHHLSSLLNEQMMIWVQQELLAQEALQRGLDTTVEVRQELELWSSYYLAEIMKAHIKSSITASEPEVWSYLKSIDSSAPVPQVQIRILRTASTDQMSEAMNDLNRGSPLESVVERWSNDPATKEQKGLTSLFPITQKWPLGEIASQLAVGQRFGPLKLSDGIYFIEVVSKKSVSLSQDTTIAVRKRAAETDLISMRQKNKINLFLAQAAKSNGFDIFLDRLKDVSVSPIPMMTYRILGFGGKMIAMPFAEPLFDWIDLEPPLIPVYP